jgi:hypothetical protein
MQVIDVRTSPAPAPLMLGLEGDNRHARIGAEQAVGSGDSCLDLLDHRAIRSENCQLGDTAGHHFKIGSQGQLSGTAVEAYDGRIRS